MQGFMSAFNFKFTRCGCLACRCFGRCSEDPDDFPARKRCKWENEWEKLIKSYGLTIDYSGGHEDVTSENVPYERCSDAEAHFVNDEDWGTWSFGNKLHTRSSTTHPDIVRYNNFLEHCNKLFYESSSDDE